MHIPLSDLRAACTRVHILPLLFQAPLVRGERTPERVPLKYEELRICGDIFNRIAHSVLALQVADSAEPTYCILTRHQRPSLTLDRGAICAEGIGNQGSLLNTTSVDMSEREIDRGT